MPLPRFSRLISTVGRSEPPWAPYPELRPWNKGILVDPAHLVASINSDEFAKNLERWRKEAMSARADRNHDRFEEVVKNMISECSKLDRNHALRLDPFLNHFDNSPLSAPLKDGLNMILGKSATAALHHTEPSLPNNRSGFAYVGPRGTGKTQLLQVLAVAPALLLDNVVSVYLQCNSDEAQSEYHWDLDLAALFRLAFQRRLQCHDDRLKAKSDIPDAEQMKWVVEKKSSMEAILTAAEANGLSLLACVDEARSVYGRRRNFGPGTSTCGAHAKTKLYNVWNQTDNMLNKFSACVFYADSTTELPELIRATDRSFICEDLGYPEARQSLNGDRIGTIEVCGLRSEEEYNAYLQMVTKYDQNILKSFEELYAQENVKFSVPEKLHVLTNGRMRAMAQILKGEQLEPYTDTEKVYDPGSLAQFLLGRMVAYLRVYWDTQDIQDKNPFFAPFYSGPYFSESTMLEFIDEYNKAASGRNYGRRDLVRLVEEQLLLQQYTTSDRRLSHRRPNYWFGSFAQLDKLNKSTPSVFVSFCWDDNVDKVISPIYRQLACHHDVHVIMCSNPDSVQRLEKIGIHRYEHDQAMRTVKNDKAYMLLAITKNYLDRIEEAHGKSESNYSVTNFLMEAPEKDLNARGVVREVRLAHQVAESGHYKKKILLVCDSDDVFERCRKILPESIMTKKRMIQNINAPQALLGLRQLILNE